MAEPDAQDTVQENSQVQEQDTKVETTEDSQAQTDTTSAPDDIIFPEEQETKAKEAESETDKEQSSEEKKEESDAEETKDSEAEDTAAESEPKEEQKKRAQEAYRKRQQTKQTIAQKVDEHYSPKTQDQLVEEGLSESDAKVEALRQEMAYREARNQVAELNANMQADATAVLSDFPIFNPKDKENYDPEFTKQVQEQYARAARLQTDENGIVVSAEEGLYDFYAGAYNLYNRGASKGTVKGQKDTLKMLSRAESPSSSSQTKAGEEDPLLAGFDRVP